jgi:cytoskeletal protein CcmA (bactofilin family)
MAKRATEPAVLGKSLRVRGRVRGEGDLRIEGVIEGDVVVSGALELGEGASVQGGVQAASLTVSGALEGDASADGPIAVTSTGSLRGDVKATELTLDEGATFVGQVEADFELPDAIA